MFEWDALGIGVALLVVVAWVQLGACLLILPPLLYRQNERRAGTVPFFPTKNQGPKARRVR